MWMLIIPSIKNNKYPIKPKIDQWYFLTRLKRSAECADIFSRSSPMK